MVLWPYKGGFPFVKIYKKGKDYSVSNTRRGERNKLRVRQLGRRKKGKIEKRPRFPIPVWVPYPLNPSPLSLTLSLSQWDF